MLVLAAAFAVIAALTNAATASAKPSAAAPAAPDQLKPTVEKAVAHDTLPSLKSLKPAATKNSAQADVLPAHAVPHPRSTTATKAATATVQSENVNTSMPAFDKNFEGVGNVNGVLPPDTQGDVGPNHYVQMINLSFAVYDKQGNRLLGPLPNTALWQGLSTPCATVNGGDPVTMYDENADRWFMSQL